MLAQTHTSLGVGRISILNPAGTLSLSVGTALMLMKPQSMSPDLIAFSAALLSVIGINSTRLKAGAGPGQFSSASRIAPDPGRISTTLNGPDVAATSAPKRPPAA